MRFLHNARFLVMVLAGQCAYAQVNSPSTSAQKAVGSKEAAVTPVAGESWLTHLNRPFNETSMGKTWRLGPPAFASGEATSQGQPDGSSDKYNAACREIRAIGLPHSAAERLAKLLFDWSVQNGEAAKAEPRFKLALTHDEMAQMIGTSRETVTRLFADLKKRQIVQTKGSTLRIRNKAALKVLALRGTGL